MQKYVVPWYYMQPDPPPGKQSSDEEVYFASDVDDLEKRLRLCEDALLLGCDWKHKAIQDYLALYPEPYQSP